MGVHMDHYMAVLDPLAKPLHVEPMLPESIGRAGVFQQNKHPVKSYIATIAKTILLLYMCHFPMALIGAKSGCC